MGSLVVLRSCPHGAPRSVLKVERDRIVVHWVDLDCVARHKADALVAG